MLFAPQSMAIAPFHQLCSGGEITLFIILLLITESFAQLNFIARYISPIIVFLVIDALFATCTHMPWYSVPEILLPAITTLSESSLYIPHQGAVTVRSLTVQLSAATTTTPPALGLSTSIARLLISVPAALTPKPSPHGAIPVVIRVFGP